MKKERSKQFHYLAKTMRQSVLDDQLGKMYSVLWETRNDEKAWVGYSENFIRVELKHNNTLELENKITNIKLTGITDNASHCMAEII